ncbi:MAG: hypothetical protein EB116_13025 [Betaproteobacteria bacterium]|nr:hypothetical protein [Betaproteobacteria bacterium]
MLKLSRAVQRLMSLMRHQQCLIDGTIFACLRLVRQTTLSSTVFCRFFTASFAVAAKLAEAVRS